MNRRLSLSAIVGVTVIGVSIARAAEPASNYEHLKVLEPMVGTWDVQFKMDNGNAISARVSYEWEKSRNFLVANWTFAGEKERAGVEVFGWDASTQEIKMWGFIDNGQRTASVWSIQGGTWTGKYDITESDGRKAKGSVIMKWKGKDSFTDDFSFSGKEGSKGTAEFKRAK